MEAKLKHLEFIQSVINRMATNSFLFKGWAITVAAILSTYASTQSKDRIVILSVFVTVAFWLIDSFYLSLERCYRDYYEEVAAAKPNNTNLSMKLSAGSNPSKWVNAALSRTLIIFYGVVAVIDLAALLLRMPK